MKLYTLDYDCNLPVTQQVNVATNTDAKIGIKVKKDGEYLNLDGSTLSVVTPEVITPEPSELLGPGAKVIKSPLPFPAAYALMTPLSAFSGGKVYGGAANFSVDISRDDETWTDYTWPANMTISYRDTAINSNIIAECKVYQGATQWTWNAWSPFPGQTTDTVPATATSRIELHFQDTAVSAEIATDPAYFRLNCIVHEPPYHATLSADAELTNGYVTFPITIGDEPTLTQNTVVVNKESIVTNHDDNHKLPPAKPSINMLFTSGVIPEGMLVLPGAYMQYGSSDSSEDGERITGYTVDGFRNILIDQATYGIIAGNTGVVNGVQTDPNKWYLCKDPFSWTPGWDLEHPLDYIKVTKPSFIQTSWQRRYLVPQPTTNDKYMFYHCSWKTEETKANFKLNVNGFKSQQGDKEYIKELPDIPTNTANLSGTYADNTTFSFDIFYK